MNSEKKKGGWKRALLIAVIILLSLALLIGGAALLFLDSVLDRLTRPEEQQTLPQELIESIAFETDPVDPDFTGPVLAPEDVTVPEDAFEKIPIEGDHIINILLVGQDGDFTTGLRRSRSDSMILCTLNKRDKTLTLTSFMRDLYVKIPGYYSQRLNVAYFVGGFDTLYETLEQNFGVVVDYGVAVNFSTFTEVIDMMGGVEIELTAAEARYMNNLIIPHEGIPYNWGLTEGVHNLTGVQALGYARNRTIGSDFERTERQRKVINKLVEKAKTMPLDQLYDMVNTLLPVIVTDMSNAEIISCALQCAPYLRDISVVSQRIPAGDSYRFASVSGMSVLIPDLEANHRFLLETLGVADKEE